jgi:ABC-type multidrug transport system fused ATPase/permease subunit
MAFPKLTRFVLDDVIGRSRSEWLGPAALGLVGAFAMRDGLNAARIRWNNRFEQNVIFDLRCALYARLQQLPVGWFDGHTTGDLLTRVIEDVNAVERLLIDGTEQGAVALLALVGVGVLLFLNHPGLALVAMTPLPFLIVGSLWYTLTAHSRHRARSRASAALNAFLADTLAGIRQVKLFGQEPHENTRFAGKADALRQGTLQVMWAWSRYQPAMSLAAGLGTAAVLWVGGRAVLSGEMSKGQLVEFLLYLGMFYQPLGQLHGLNQMIQAARAAGERVFGVLDAAVEPAPRGESPVPEGWRARGEVVMEDVVVTYEENRPALKGVSLTARPGEMIALVGATGAGKTTLVNLLPRFYLPVSGVLRLDGIELGHLPLAVLRRQIAVVSQEAFLFNGTILENLLYGQSDASREQIESAARAAEIHDFIQGLPAAYETQVGERGVRLSVGEKQRLSIARALLKDAPVLVLDEATASVDTGTERLIQAALERLLKGRTSFVVAHRLSTVRRADQILVLEGGRVVERGRHEDLVASGGVYARLLAFQVTPQA